MIKVLQFELVVVGGGVIYCCIAMQYNGDWEK